MKKTKVLKGVAIFCLLCLFIFSSFGFGLTSYPEKANSWYEYDESIHIDADETWHKGDELVFDQSIFIENGATLTIEPGTTIKFKRSSDWTAPTVFILGGRIFASGTAEDPIIFESESSDDTFFINFENTPDRLEKDVLPSFFRFVEINGGGEEYSGGPIQGYQKKSSIFPVAMAADGGIPTFLYQGGKLHIENSRFSNNKYADIEVTACNGQDNPFDYLEVVNSNFEGDFDRLAIKSNTQYESGEDCTNKVILQDNWYGSIGGPTQEDSLTDKGKKIIGQYQLLGWKFNDLRNDPVIIIPGITGSSEVNGKWKMDPITHTYDNLTESLVRNGYTKNKNLFEFPYDWKVKNEITANFLKTKIEEILTSTRVSRVDLVAHSMGGLVARAYIEGSNYRNSVDQLVTLGTPHRGAPKSYLQWEAGEGFFMLNDKIAKHHFTQEAKHNGYDSLFDYIKSEVLSIAELLPDYSYLINAGNNATRNYPDDYPRNVFLEELNVSQNREKLGQVDFTNIVGDMENEKTISGIRVGERGTEGKWENGMPENFYNTDTDRGLNYASGDITVPLFSATDIVANKNITVKSSHGDLPTKAQCEVVSELTNMPKEDCQYTTVFNVANIFLINVFSPIDIQVVAPDGKRVGKNFATGEVFNEIEGAYYSGSNTDSEVVAIPNPESGNYQILAQGTGNGGYQIEVSKITENENNANAVAEISKTISGQAEIGKIGEEKVILSEKSIEVESETPMDINGIIENVKQYSKLNLIKTKSDTRNILNLLTFLKWQEKNIQIVEVSRIPDNKKQKILVLLRKNFNQQVGFLVNYINKLVKKKLIDTSIKDALVRDVLSLKKS